MSWTQIGILYRRELRSAMRERSIVVNGILVPIFLYPIMLWVMFTALTFVQGVNEGFTSRIALEGEPPAAHRALLDTLGTHEGVELLGGAGADEDSLPRERWDGALAGGELDAVVSFRSVASPLPDNFAVEVRYDRAGERSRQAHARVRGIVDDYRNDWLGGRAEALSLSERDRTVFALVGENVSSSEEVGQLLMGQMLSVFLIIMVALGCFVPSVDTTAGERERSTWETLMTVSASRSSIVAAKYLYVATLGIVAGLLNVAALVISMGAVVRPLLEGREEAITFSIPWMAVPVMLAGAVALALFFAAAMMILASFARSFKDGQAMVTPVYWLVFLPLLLGDQSDTTLTLETSLIPVANVAMMIRDAMGGVFLWEWIGVTLAVTLALVMGCLLLARQILRFEEFLMGSFDGSFWRFAKEKLFA